MGGRATEDGERFEKGILRMLEPLPLGQTYLVAIYNKAVRALVKENQSHFFFDDQWADIHTQDVAAISEAEARSKMAARYPPEEGFVIESIVTSPA